nr:MAG TPA: hypothetical protein [Caudoviricetes sp.]DAS85422.1 MAG TPA: hypothetical protein [Caudoviricetes sp.]DAZ61938.1 MAG TPA: hypothetical protein [Caudoviricetes sp.]
MIAALVSVLVRKITLWYIALFGDVIGLLGSDYAHTL